MRFVKLVCLMLVGLATSTTIASGCAYNPRPLPPREDENESGCELKAKADYQVCLASGRDNKACDQMHDGVFMRCLMYGGALDAGAGESVPKAVELPGVR